MSNATRWTLFCSVLALLSVGGYRLGRTRVLEDRSPLVVNADCLNFGEVWGQDSFPWSVTIRNTLRVPIKISRLQSSCSCTAVEPRTLTVPANAAADITLIIDLTTNQPDLAALPVRDFAVVLTAEIDGGSRSQISWQVNGNVRNAFALTPSPLGFGESLVAGSPFEARQGDLLCHHPMQSLKASCDERFASVRLTPAAEDSRRYYLDVLPSEDLPVGKHDFEVILQGIDKNGQQIPPVALPVHAPVLSDVELVPDLVPLGRVQVGDTVSRSLVVRSRTGKEFTVMNPKTVTTHNVRFKWNGPTGQTEKAAGHIFDIHCVPLKAGQQTARVPIRVRYPNRSSEDAPLRVTFFATDPDIAAAPDADAESKQSHRTAGG